MLMAVARNRKEASWSCRFPSSRRRIFRQSLVSTGLKTRGYSPFGLRVFSDALFILYGIFLKNVCSWCLISTGLKTCGYLPFGLHVFADALFILYGIFLKNVCSWRLISTGLNPAAIRPLGFASLQTHYSSRIAFS